MASVLGQGDSGRCLCLVWRNAQISSSLLPRATPSGSAAVLALPPSCPRSTAWNLDAMSYQLLFRRSKEAILVFGAWIVCCAQSLCCVCAAVLERKVEGQVGFHASKRTHCLPAFSLRRYTSAGNDCAPRATDNADNDAVLLSFVLTLTPLGAWSRVIH